MHISILLMEQIVELFIMILMGFIIVKAGIVKDEDSKVLSNIQGCFVSDHTVCYYQCLSGGLYIEDGKGTFDCPDSLCDITGGTSCDHIHYGQAVSSE